MSSPIPNKSDFKKDFASQFIQAVSADLKSGKLIPNSAGDIFISPKYTNNKRLGPEYEEEAISQFSLAGWELRATTDEGTYNGYILR